MYYLGAVKLKALIYFILITLTVTGCKKSNNKVDTTISGNAVAVDEIGLSGIIKQPDGYPAEGVEVRIDGHKIITSADGLFEYKGRVKDADKVVITVFKTGFFQYSKVVTLQKGAMLPELEIWLVGEYDNRTFEASSGATLSTSYVTLIIEPNSLAKMDGTAYIGRVTAKLPLKGFDGLNKQFPGDVRGLSAAKEKVVVETWGGINIRLFDDEGNALKLIKPMKYTYNVGPRYIFIKKKINIWAYNETDHVWEDTGEAIVASEKFTGSTLNLNYIQWGISHGRALLNAYVLDNSISLKPIGYNFGYAFDINNRNAIPSIKLNSNARALIYVPANTRELKPIITNECGETAEVASYISAIAAGSKFEQYFWTDLAAQVKKLEGTIENCDFTLLKGRGEYTFGGKTYTCKINGGAFKFSFFDCKGNYPGGKLVLYDEQDKVIYQNDTYMRGDAFDYPIVSTCTKPQVGKITIRLQDKVYTFQSPQDNIQFLTTSNSGQTVSVVTAESTERKESFVLTYTGTSAGNFTLLSFYFIIPNKSYWMTWGYFPRGTTDVTKYKKDNTLIEGTFNTKTHLNFNTYGNNEIVDLSGEFSIMW